jgi:membrane protease YdiL (CAAX protease family)
MAFVLIAVQFIIANIWTILTPPDILTKQNQLNSLINNGVNSLFVGFIIALTAAIGEEIVFRGALQPIFGLWPTAIFFAMSHIQYTFTPAALIIVFVGVGLGWVRFKYNTTTSMVTHFLYDYLDLALTLMARLPVT